VATLAAEHFWLVLVSMLLAVGIGYAGKRPF
jgi:hypothetical protein